MFTAAYFIFTVLFVFPLRIFALVFFAISEVSNLIGEIVDLLAERSYEILFSIFGKGGN